MKQKTHKIAYNVYTGKFWNGFWFCANRKAAAPVDSAFCDGYLARRELTQISNIRFHTVKR